MILGEFGLIGKFIADKIDGEPGSADITGSQSSAGRTERILYQKRDEAGRIWQTVYTSDVDLSDTSGYVVATNLETLQSQYPDHAVRAVSSSGQVIDIRS
jgi:hypothetical protein